MKKLLKVLVIFMLMLVTLYLPKNAFAAVTQYTDNVIPMMTSNTSPSGVASASSEYRLSASNSCQAYWAFNHYYSSGYSAWISLAGVRSGWLSYEFPNPKCITKYTIISRVPCDIPELPKNWTFEAFDVQLNNWVVLDTEVNITDWTAGVKKEFSFLNNKLYSKYRINVTSNVGQMSQDYLAIGELEMMETVSAPTNLTSKAGDKSIQLSWHPVIGASRYNIKRYNEITHNYDTIGTIDSNPATLTDTDISYIDDEITNGITYKYVVSTIVEEIESTNSNEVSCSVGSLSAPFAISATSDQGSKQITVKWNAVTGATGYGVYRSNTTGTNYYPVISSNLSIDTTTNPITCIDKSNNLEYGKTYYYKIKAIYSTSESEFSNEVSTTPVEPIPAAPILSAKAGNNSIQLSWNPIDGAKSYNIKRGTISGSYTSIIPFTPNATNISGSAITYIDENLANGTTYYYVVSVVNSSGESANSNEIYATPTEPIVTGNNAILEITMNNGTRKEYDLTAAELDSFLTWYDSRSAGLGKAYYKIAKKSNVKPFLSRYEIIKFDNIESFEFKEYNE